MVTHSTLGRASNARGDAKNTVMLDPAQRTLTDEVFGYLHNANTTGSTHSLSHRGYYIYGPPGRGKTWLMTELFHAAPCPADAKRQVHFHEFFRRLQHHLGAHLSSRDAISATLVELLTDAELLLFDELHVHDPGSAALLNRLLAEVVQRGIPTLITSNYAPEGLLPDQMFHHIIEPSISILREHFSIRTLDGGTDYRRQQAHNAAGFASGAWLVAGPGQRPDQVLRAAGLQPPEAAEATTVLDGHRRLMASAVRGAEIWFDFVDLLQTPSMTSDYLDLADHYDFWVLTNVPRLSKTDPASRQRLVTLIDVLVERDIALTVSAEAPRDHIVDIATPPPDLFRTQSRLALLQGC